MADEVTVGKGLIVPSQFASWLVRSAILVMVFLGCSLHVSAASAQQIPSLDVATDPNGVDVFKGKVETTMPELSIPAAPNLTFSQPQFMQPILMGEVLAPEIRTAGDGASPLADFNGPSSGLFEPTAIETASRYNISTGSGAAGFMCDEVCKPNMGDGSSLFAEFQTGDFTLIEGQTGREFRFDQQIYGQGFPGFGQEFYYYPSTLKFPNGEVHTYSYYTETVNGFVYRRLSQITSNVGYVLKFTYENPVYGTGWNLVSKAEIVSSAAPTIPLAQYTYLRVGNELQITDLVGRVLKCTGCSNSNAVPAYQRGISATLPGETTTSISSTAAQRTYGSISHALFVTQIVSDGATYDYAYEVGDDPYRKPTKVTVTGPENFSRVFNIANATYGERPYLTSMVDSQGRITSYDHDGSRRINKVTYPELNAVSVVFDTSGNIIERRAIAKPGSGLADIVTTAEYDDDIECGSFMCFLPEWTKDANGNQTDYTWSAAHGGLVTRLAPANAQGKRRLTSNSYVQAPSGPWRLAEEEVCEANAAGTPLTCGTAASFVRQFTYLNKTLLPLTTTVTDGLGNGPLTTTFTYDEAGRQLSSDGPLPGSDDATYARYDVLGRRTWEIGPKGENGLRPATRTTYRDADDKPTKVETGTLTSPTDTNLVLIAETSTTYNTRRLAIETRISDGSTDYSVTQISYDTRNREQCSAIRMNAATWANLPASACDPTTPATPSSDGPDRISQKHYDTESRVIRIEQGIGTSLVRDYATYTFLPNGQMASMTDARGFKASMLYDGFDRQTHWHFPAPNTTGAINPNDYEQYTYDANGNRLTLRKRDGSVLSFTYDNLNRVTRKTVPIRAGLAATHTRDVIYAYDIRGLQTLARFDNYWTGQGLATMYDRYGRVSRNMDTMDGIQRDLYYFYDVAGNRTRLLYPDSKSAYYTYTSGGQFNQVKDHGSTVIADYNYNARGELNQINRDGSAPDQDWTYDPIGRLASTGWSNAASADNVTWSFTRNPASQIRTETQTNDSYSWDGHVDRTISYTANGLNQYTAVGNNAYAYDANGNLTDDGAKTYLYDIENRLVEMSAKVNPSGCASGSALIQAKLRYDPMGRLHEVENFVCGIAQGPTRFLYDGDALVAEYDGANAMLARYIHGPAAGADDPLVEYIGAGVTAADRRNLYADARGSIVLSTDSAGGTAQINTYDEYGVPGSANTGRFQYTGQIWLAELGMNYYKARMYSPTLGRFMQTDPIGYEDNVNLYGYVGNDPINRIDFTGKRSRAAEAEAQLRWRIAQANLDQAIDEGQKKPGTTPIPKSARAGVVLLPLLLGCSSPPCTHRVYATYTKTDPESGRTYSGRTSIIVPQGTDIRVAATAAVARRDARHHTADSYGPAVLDRYSTDSSAVRGREQMLIDHFGGATSQGGTSGNTINGISNYNVLRFIYISASEREFGPLQSNAP